MKHPLFTLVMMVAILATTACDQLSNPRPPAELITGKWQFEKLDLPKADLDRLESYERAQLAQMQIQLKMMRYNFFNDGTYSMDMELGEEFNESIERGSYRLINDGAVLVTEHVNKKSNKAETSEMSVLRLSEDSLLLSEKKDKASMLFLRIK
jgi:phage-related protein